MLIRGLVISAIRDVVEVFVSFFGTDTADYEKAESCTGFILRELDSFSKLYRIGIFTLLICLALEQKIKLCIPFSKVPAYSIRKNVLQKWSISRNPTKRKTYQLLLNLVIIAYFDNPKVLKENKIDLSRYREIQGFYNSHVSNV